MKRLHVIIYAIVLISLCSFGYAQCEKEISKIPPMYLRNVTIVVHNYNNSRYEGIYKFTPQVVELRKGCNLRALIHELAHHKNKIDGVRIYDSIRHKEEFKEAEAEIWQSIN